MTKVLDFPTVQFDRVTGNPKASSKANSKSSSKANKSNTKTGQTSTAGTVPTTKTYERQITLPFSNEPDMTPKKKPRPYSSEKYARSGMKWSKAEEDKMMLLSSTQEPFEVAHALQRSETSVVLRLQTVIGKMFTEKLMTVKNICQKTHLHETLVIKNLQALGIDANANGSSLESVDEPTMKNSFNLFEKRLKDLEHRVSCLEQDKHQSQSTNEDTLCFF